MVLTSGVFSTGDDSLVGLCRVSVQLVQKIVATPGNSVYRLVYSVYSLSTSLFTALSTLFMGMIVESRGETVRHTVKPVRRHVRRLKLRHSNISPNN